MQVKKDEIRQKILQSAQDIFLDIGYEKASIRRIVAAAQTTIGNFYNYFSGKEELFSALVEDTYGQVIHYLNHHHDSGNDLSMFVDQPSNLRSIILSYARQLVPLLNDPLLLLLDCSQGTRFAHTKDELCAKMAENFHEHMADCDPPYPYPELGTILSNQFINSVIDVLKIAQNDEDKAQWITELMISNITGIMALLQTHNK